MKTVISCIIVLTSISDVMLLHAQNCNFRTDTVYLITLWGSKKNAKSYKLTTCIALHSLERLSTNIDSIEGFLQSCFEGGIYCGEIVYQGFAKGIEKCDTTILTFAQRRKKIDEFIMKYAKVTESITSDFDDIRLKDSSSISLSIVKVIGEFWMIDIQQKPLINHEINLPWNIYPYRYFYRFKSIQEALSLSESDLQCILRINAWER